jgi:hypothetical protein
MVGTISAIESFEQNHPVLIANWSLIPGLDFTFDTGHLSNQTLCLNER